MTLDPLEQNIEATDEITSHVHEHVLDTKKIEARDLTQRTKEKCIAEREAILLSQVQEVENGTHPELVRKLKMLEEEKNEKLWLIRVWQNYEHQCIRNRTVAQEKQAEEESLQEQREMKEKLINRCLGEQKKLEERATNSEQRSTRRTLRRRLNTRDIPTEGDLDDITAVSELKLCLNDREIRDDLGMMLKYQTQQ